MAAASFGWRPLVTGEPRAIAGSGPRPARALAHAAPTLTEPIQQHGGEARPWVWSARSAGVELRFGGRGLPADLESCVVSIAGHGQPRPAISWAHQVHSTRVLAASAGCAGEGDALVTTRTNLALAVVTADCVPVLLVGSGHVGAAHAGWRGLAGGVLGATVAAMGGVDRAWIGPAIGPCCYEVGEPVATAVAAASGADVIIARTSGRPHLDLWQAARRQLLDAGVGEIALVRHCTRCSPQLWSYRRDGPGAGRNLALVWRSAPSGSDPT